MANTRVATPFARPAYRSVRHIPRLDDRDTRPIPHTLTGMVQ